MYLILEIVGLFFYKTIKAFYNRDKSLFGGL